MNEQSRLSVVTTSTTDSIQLKFTQFIFAVTMKSYFGNWHNHLFYLI